MEGRSHRVPRSYNSGSQSIPIPSLISLPPQGLELVPPPIRSRSALRWLSLVGFWDPLLHPYTPFSWTRFLWLGLGWSEIRDNNTIYHWNCKHNYSLYKRHTYIHTQASAFAFCFGIGFQAIILFPLQYH